MQTFEQVIQDVDLVLESAVQVVLEFWSHEILARVEDIDHLVKAGHLFDQIEERFDASQQCGRAARLDDDPVLGDEH